MFFMNDECLISHLTRYVLWERRKNAAEKTCLVLINFREFQRTHFKKINFSIHILQETKLKVNKNW